VLGVAFLLVTNLPWQLDDYDQAKQAYTSFEMVKEGHWLYQHTPHERIATKPPLVGWVSAGIYLISRSWALAWRLPSFLAAIALALLLFRAGRVYGPTAAVVATSAFVFNLLTPRLATLVRTDMPLAFAISAVGLLIWNKIRLRQQWSRQDRWLLFALLTAAMLIKGPIVYAFLLPGMIVAAIYDRRKFRSPAVTNCPDSTSWSGWWPWILSLTIFLLWAIAGSVFVPGFYDQVVSREFLGRFGETIHRPQPLLFYIPHLLHKFFPWSVLTIAVGFFPFRFYKFDRLKRSSSQAPTDTEAARDELDGQRPSSFATGVLGKVSPGTLWLICWIFGGLIVMSIIPSKRVDRIFPIIPPLCLLLSSQIGNGRNGSASDPTPARPGPSRMGISAPYFYIALTIAIAFAGGYSGFKVFTGYRNHRNALVEFGRKVRLEAATHNWRYEVLKSNDEGMLLYLEKLHFIDPAQAIQSWNDGTVNALVLPAKAMPVVMGDLNGAALSPITSANKAYVVITR
jgi:4-amino-4-deoxy-L-arabinose transferase-like glycosyltransferase